VSLVVQVNGKVRGEIQLALDADEATALTAAAAVENVAKFTEGKRTQKVIYRAGKILNIVVA
jgi:leucyl-tRNA synthetase